MSVVLLTQRTVLDPYLLNIVPKSLVPTGIHLTIIAIIGWYLSGAIWVFLDEASKSSVKSRTTKFQQKKDS